MASAARNTRDRRLLFPIGALIFSEGVDQLVRAGRLDPLPYFQRHTRGDWGNVTDDQWQENNAALTSGRRLDSLYPVTRELTLHIYTEADRRATYIALPSET